jgi:hypothetical protein
MLMAMQMSTPLWCVSCSVYVGIQIACQPLVEGGKTMASEDMVTRLSFGRVRRIYWYALTAALFASLLLPIVTIWHTANAALHVQACLWPAAPHRGQPAQLLVTPLTATDRTALQGPWAHAVIDWNMVDMQMSTHPVDVQGDADARSAFSIPLTLNMAGKWWIRITLHAPGRPSWQTQLHVTVLDPGELPLDTTGKTASSAATACLSGGSLQARAGGRGESGL